MNSWLVTGAGGRLARELCALLPSGSTTALTREDLDLSDPYATDAALAELRPSVVVNCAARTDVDEAEKHEDAALEVNGHAVARLAASCARVDARLLHVSTAYVFGGLDGLGAKGGGLRLPYDEDALPDPRNAYGRSKLAGERAVLETLPDTGTIVRTGWLYGPCGRSFVRTMAERALAGASVIVATDEYGQPTWTREVAERLVVLGSGPTRPGIHHASASGSTSRWELACQIYRLLGRDPGLVLSATSADLDRAAPRPAWSVLGHRRWAREGMSPLRDWRDMLREALPSVTAALGPKETPVSDATCLTAGRAPDVREVPADPR
ncbi:dTDP-4-dehydrorhamnose reductase [Streptomyces buecherae]|uniref:dTDP-4-dehydrorhamnose reductase n=1 Tax=Streptomyces buecherae TaxID=2763006 RepID=UPI00378EB71F